MKNKVGDILIYKCESDNCFTYNKGYKIVDFKSHTHNYNSTMLIDDNKQRHELSANYIKEHFYSIKERRKIKLEKLRKKNRIGKII